MQPATPRHGTVLLFLLGLITVMLVVAFAFARNMQMAGESMHSQRREELSRHAAEMGLQHAMAVCMREYAMDSEVRDGATVTGSRLATHPDGLGKNVFNPMAPQTTGYKQPPQDYDMAPDVPFQDLFSMWGGSTYHFYSSRVTGFSQGYTMVRGYGRWIEANRWDYDPSQVYDASSYDNYDASPARAPSYLKAVQPIPGGVSTPFPPVDPYTSGELNRRPVGDPRYNALDNPLLLDADCRPVTDVARARYRLRYAVTTYDMSGALWANTDMPWLDDVNNPAAGAARKHEARRQYKDVIDCVGRQMVALELFQYRIKGSYRNALESIFLGYGPQTNSHFRSDAGHTPGIPYDWPTRNPDGFGLPFPKPGQPMAYRSDFAPNDAWRAYHSVLGTPFMNLFDPLRPDGSRRWLGSAIASWTDLAFASSDLRSMWEARGEASYEGRLGARADLFAQRAATPFGRPYDIDGHPWAVNILSAPSRVIQAMVSAYVPPAARRVRVLSESQIPRFRYTDETGVEVTGLATTAFTYKGQTWTPGTWAIPASANLTIAGVGFDLFTDAFQPQGTKPFDYPTPADRDYWGSDPAVRRAFTDVADERTNVGRYPGEHFYSRTDEPDANRMTRWNFRDAATGTAITPRPWQLHSDSEPAANIAKPASGVDHLARHIVFYAPDFSTDPPSQDNVLGEKVAHDSNSRYITAYTGLGKNWQQDFYPATPFGVNLSMNGADAAISIYLPSTTTVYLGSDPVTYCPPGTTYRAVKSGEDFSIPPQDRGDVDAPGTWLIQRSTTGDQTDAVTTAVNSYWQRLSLAFMHAVCVTQVANLAWADPQDNRSQAIWAAVGGSPPAGNFPASLGFTGGPTYARSPVGNSGIARKRPGSWDPKQTDFATIEQVDRQFLANLGESFERPGSSTPADVILTERPPRYLRNQNRGSGPYPGPSTLATGTNLNVAEYRVTNNIRTLLTPLDTSGTAMLTASSADAQAAPPRNLWLLDEWNAEGDPDYEPSVESPYSAGKVGTHPTRLARARAKLMERVLNDWRMNFFGSGKGYIASFRPKDFDGDGKVFCSGYLANATADGDTGLTCWEVAEAGGDGPAAGKLTVFSVTGCLTFTRSHQYKIHVRGELVDNVLNRAVSENYLEGALLIDPDSDTVRGGALPTGLDDTTLILLHPIDNYYRGYLSRSYP
jgi:hypothetical protein